MAIPLLNYTPASQNQRVAGYEIPGEEKPRMYSTDNVLTPSDVEEVIWAAYRQVFSEHQILKSNRQIVLESLLKNSTITVRDFIRGLATSETFLERNYQTNNNYRFVEMCVQRILGRDVYSEREKIAWSIVIATKGVEGFINQLLDSDEYMTNFGENTVPFQRRRVLPQRPQGEMPFNLKTPRYNEYHRAQLGFPQIVWQNAVRRFIPQEKQPKAGDPSGYLGMAREISPRPNPIPRVSAENIDFLARVPRRR
ncbi:MAG: phycobilisome rod-core linker polypeptide CpcG [Coleofasciculaceae cyanobacterium SM2_3_26]|nr:phycobilisome rod-core linker polypeptide CpcG [Coleofasciculaceae cyanobacterium SM2_3_26]